MNRAGVWWALTGVAFLIGAVLTSGKAFFLADGSFYPHLSARAVGMMAVPVALASVFTFRLSRHRRAQVLFVGSLVGLALVAKEFLDERQQILASRERGKQVGAEFVELFKSRLNSVEQAGARITAFSEEGQLSYGQVVNPSVRQMVRDRNARFKALVLEHDHAVAAADIDLRAFVANRMSAQMQGKLGEMLKEFDMAGYYSKVSRTRHQLAKVTDDLLDCFDRNQARLKNSGGEVISSNVRVRDEMAVCIARYEQAGQAAVAAQNDWEAYFKANK